MRKGCSIFWFPSFELKKKIVEKTRADGKTILPPFGQLGGFCFRETSATGYLFFLQISGGLLSTDGYIADTEFCRFRFCCFHS